MVIKVPQNKAIKSCIEQCLFDILLFYPYEYSTSNTLTSNQMTINNYCNVIYVYSDMLLPYICMNLRIYDDTLL